MFYKLSEEDELRLVRDFTYRQPKEDQIPRFKEIREMAMVLALVLVLALILVYGVTLIVIGDRCALGLI